MKTCTKCRVEKDVSAFHKASSQKDGLKNICKQCASAAIKNYYQKNKDVFKNLYNKKNNKRHSENKKEWYLTNKNSYKNNASVREKVRANYSGKKRYTPIRRVRRVVIKKKKPKAVLKMIANAKHIGTLLKTESTSRSVILSLLCVDVKTARKYIERQFKKGMTWGNHGRNGWHVDHKIPLTSAETIEDVKILCHYKNLQPLWARDNYVKNSKITAVQLAIAI